MISIDLAACGDRAARALAVCLSAPAWADGATLDKGDTAWMLTSTALVLMMTIPGLALFYGGMVRKMNVLATIMQSFAVTCLVTVLWMIVGYSIAFTDGNALHRRPQPLLPRRAWGRSAVNSLAPTIPRSVYMCFQMTFAIITPALIARLVRRPHEVLGPGVVHGAVAGPRLFADRPHGVGTRRLAGRLRRARLRRRHRRAHQRRRRRPGRRPS
mgnify:CR=1 FL=1